MNIEANLAMKIWLRTRWFTRESKRFMHWVIQTTTFNFYICIVIRWLCVRMTTPERTAFIFMRWLH